MLILVGAFLPLLVATINRSVKNSDLRFWISAFIAALVGIIVNFIQHNGPVGYIELTLLQIVESFAESIMSMIGMSKISYEGFWNSQEVSKHVPDSVLEKESILEKLDLKKA